jgi:hypothetical protein
MSEGFFSRGFRGRRRQPEQEVHLPPGQYLVEGFPVLSAGPEPLVMSGISRSSGRSTSPRGGRGRSSGSCNSR